MRKTVALADENSLGGSFLFLSIDIYKIEPYNLYIVSRYKTMFHNVKQETKQLTIAKRFATAYCKNTLAFLHIKEKLK